MKRVNETEWRDETERSDALLLKAVDTEVSESEEERVLNFRISTETVDSYDDVIKADGWDLKRFLKNPVVLWAHDHRQPPIGKALSVGVEDTDLVASAKFADAETYAFADTIFRLLKQGYLRATSVGFFPKEWTYDEERHGYNFIEQELFEFSVVPVPANPDALTMAVSDGIDCAPLKEWAEKTLDLWEPDGDGDDDETVALWVPRAQIEGIQRALAGDVTSVTVTKTQAVGDLTATQSTLYETGTITPKTGDSIPPVAPNGDDVGESFSFKVDLDEETKELLTESVKTLCDEVENLTAQVDQLGAKVRDLEETSEVSAADGDDGVDDMGELFDVIDIQEIDSHEVESEVDLAILDLEITPEELQKAIRREMGAQIMKTTGTLPKEV